MCSIDDGRLSNLDSPAEQVGQRSHRAAIRHVLHVDARHHLEHLAGDVARAANARRGHVQLAGLGLGHRDELSDRLHRKRIGDGQYLKAAAERRDRRDVAGKINRAIERGVDHVVRRNDQQCVAIGRRPGDHFGCDVGGGARPILHNERLAEPLLKPVADHPSDDVDRLPRRKADDDPHRPAWIGLCIRDSGKAGQRCRGCGELEERTPGTIHGHGPSRAFKASPTLSRCGRAQPYETKQARRTTSLPSGPYPGHKIEYAAEPSLRGEHMTTTPSAEQFEFLRSIDTPTVCNLLEIVAPERRGFGYTVRHLHCPFPDLPPMVGFAKTVVMRAQDRVPLGEAGYMNKRLDYLDYVASQPQPGIAVIQDVDEIAGFGAFWGEVQTNIHKALGCLGTITNGSIRDIPQVAPGFQMLAGSIAPSHAFVHVVDFGGSVNIHGMAVRSGDLIHADRHGAVVVPLNTIDGMKDAAPKLAAKEAQIIDAAKSGKGVEAIKAAMK
jgi:regulator of RNase E activity RraA